MTAAGIPAELHELAGDGVRLRGATERDLRAVEQASREQPGSPAGGAETDGTWRYAIDASGDGDTVNLVGLITFEITHPIASISYAIVPAARRRGLATRAVRLALDWLFDGSGLDIATVTWTAPAGDTAAWRVAWANGFTFEGTSRRSIARSDGTATDAWHATLLRTDARDPKTRWLPMPVLDAGAVILRPVAMTDQDRFLETIDDEQTRLWLHAVNQPHSVAEFADFVTGQFLGPSLGRSLSWSVADPATDRYLASITLFDLTGLDYKSGEVGYRTHPDARGRGVLTTALRTVLTHAFAPADEGGVGLERVGLLAGEGNEASQGVARACGFTRTGVDRSCYDLSDGRVVDLARFDLLRSEFLSRLS